MPKFLQKYNKHTKHVNKNGGLTPAKGGGFAAFFALPGDEFFVPLSFVQLKK
jgi:hypothetical protein